MLADTFASYAFAGRCPAECSRVAQSGEEVEEAPQPVRENARAKVDYSDIRRCEEGGEQREEDLHRGSCHESSSTGERIPREQRRR